MNKFLRDCSDIIGGESPTEPQPIAAILEPRALAEIAGVGERQLFVLKDRGILIPHGRGKYAAKESITNLIASLRRRSTAQLDDEKIRLTREQADKVELANAKVRQDLIPASEVEATWAAIVRDLRSSLLAMPTRLQQRLPHLTAHDVTAIDRELRTTLEGLANG